MTGGVTRRVARRQERNDVSLLEPRSQLYLTLETLGADPHREIRRENLYDNLSVEAVLGGRIEQVDERWW